MNVSGLSHFTDAKHVEHVQILASKYKVTFPSSYCTLVYIPWCQEHYLLFIFVFAPNILDATGMW